MVQAAAQHAVERVQLGGVVAAKAQRAFHGLVLRLRLRMLRRLLRLLLLRLRLWAVSSARCGRLAVCGAGGWCGIAVRMRRTLCRTLRRLV